ncbi:hypothetical protein [Acidiferrimicrobium sp. IK]|uniref:hypothetical protein n=1 Tax=Acidiferrimicrobium sp. IK TaxID=2871700 RepID=UPI0021CB8317|nr:hypothetical protein [Acidiferrimicrobium sp. IK]
MLELTVVVALRETECPAGSVEEAGVTRSDETVEPWTWMSATIESIRISAVAVLLAVPPRVTFHFPAPDSWAVLVMDTCRPPVGHVDVVVGVAWAVLGALSGAPTGLLTGGATRVAGGAVVTGALGPVVTWGWEDAPGAASAVVAVAATLDVGPDAPDGVATTLIGLRPEESTPMAMPATAAATTTPATR